MGVETQIGGLQSLTRANKGGILYQSGTGGEALQRFRKQFEPSVMQKNAMVYILFFKHHNSDS